MSVGSLPQELGTMNYGFEFSVQPTGDRQTGNSTSESIAWKALSS